MIQSRWRYLRLGRESIDARGVRTSALVRIVLQNSKNGLQLFFRKTTKQEQPSIDAASNAPPKSPVSSSQNEVVPHINIRSPRPQPGKIVVSDPKRVLQHNRAYNGLKPDIAPCPKVLRIAEVVRSFRSTFSMRLATH
jgi:hypothetical protein